MKKPTKPAPLLKVWWIPQVPGKPFEVRVQNIAEARLLIDALTDYDLFQFDHNIKPDYCNAGGLQVCVGAEWEDWEDEHGRNIEDKHYARTENQK